MPGSPAGRARSESRRTGSRRKPSLKIIQLGLSISSRTLPVSRSRKLTEIQDVDAAQAAFEQLVHREGAAAVVHRHHDFIHVVLARIGQKRSAWQHQAFCRHVQRVTVWLDIADDKESALVGPAAQAGKCSWRAGRSRRPARGA